MDQGCSSSNILQNNGRLNILVLDYKVTIRYGQEVMQMRLSICLFDRLTGISICITDNPVQAHPVCDEYGSN